jgi:hypothetical protein
MLFSTEFQQLVSSVVCYGSEYRVDALTAIRSAYSIGNYEQLQKMKWRRSLACIRVLPINTAIRITCHLLKVWEINCFISWGALRNIGTFFFHFSHSTNSSLRSVFSVLVQNPQKFQTDKLTIPISSYDLHWWTSLWSAAACYSPLGKLRTRVYWMFTLSNNFRRRSRLQYHQKHG